MRRVPSSPLADPRPRLGRERAHQQSIILQLIAPILLLAAPFVGFLQYHEYSIFTAEVAVLMSVMIVFGAVLGTFSLVAGRFVSTAIITALGLFFIDFQFGGFLRSGTWMAIAGSLIFLASYLTHHHVAQVVTAMFGTILVSTLVLMVTEKTPAQPAQEYDSTPSSGLPVVVHLILDEHVGLDGFPREIETADNLRRIVQSSYHRNNFSTFEAAYGEYHHTSNALGHLLNLTPDYKSGICCKTISSQSFALGENEYLKRLLGLGFRVSVYQSAYLDLCSVPRAELRCMTYRYDRLSPIQSAPLPLRDKARLIARAYFDTAAKNSTVHREVRELYRRAREVLESTGAHLPFWREQSAIMTGPIESLSILEQLKSEVAKAKSGDFFMAHLLVPHAPYVYDSECRLKRISEWVNGWDTELSSAARRQIYQKYLEQVACLYARLNSFFAELRSNSGSDNMVVIIHGDHGSRITLTDLSTSSGLENMPPSDYVDLFSTLFAVKLPGQEPIVNHDIVSINYLVRGLLSNEFRALPALDDPAANPGIYVPNDSGQLVRRPFTLPVAQ